MAEAASSQGRQERAGEIVVETTRIAPTLSVASPTSPPPPASASAVSSDPAPERMLPRAVYPMGWTNRDLRRALALIFTVAVALCFLWQVQSILPPFLFSFFLAALLDPTLRYLEKNGRWTKSRVRAILTLYLFGLCLVILVGVLVIPAARTQVEEISGNFSVYYTGIQHFSDSFLHRNKDTLRLFGIKQENMSELVNQKSSPVQKAITAALGGMTGFLQDAASKILWLIIIPVATFFFMRDYPCMRARIISLFPEKHHDQIDRMSREILDVFSAYLRGLAKVCVLYGITAYFMFSLLGLRYALFLAIVAGAFYAVPYVGQLVTSIACGTVAYQMEAHRALLFVSVPLHSSGYVVTVVFCAIIAQNLFDQLVYPRVVGASVGLHPVISIFALMSGATLFGLWGMLLAVPVAASIQIVLTYGFPKLAQEPPANLLDDTPPLA